MPSDELKKLQEEYKIEGLYKNKLDRAAAIWNMMDQKKRKLEHMEEEKRKKAEAVILESSADGSASTSTSPVAPVSLRSRAATKAATKAAKKAKR